MLSRDEHDPLPPDVPRGPIQVVYAPKSEFVFFWKVLAAVTAALIVGGISFIGGATWSHNGRITTLEAYKVYSERSHDKLEDRVNKLESRITR